MRRSQELLSPLWDLPLLWFGYAPLTALACGGVLLSVRAGRPRLGRVLARSAATVVIVRHLPSQLLLMLDLSAGPGCAESWGPPEILGQSVMMDLYHLVPALLVLLAVRGRKAVQEDVDAPDGAVQLLIMVFPGEERRPVIYRDHPSGKSRGTGP
ncbi:hypothetical protein FHR32_000038 [Streptosporangium album]|uniref:Uncharacterized protein n=1 Tax=Streptosporangium album TaxID=47479 RepID=A0A7W7RPC9_9ACTN|nr:hypothetical protein [Streptosporangium album]MBB4935733.1 hypothetical protein [Streptosporangium album]